MCPLLETWPPTQACVLTGNRTTDPLVHRPALNPLSHTSQGNNKYYTWILIDKMEGLYKCGLGNFLRHSPDRHKEEERREISSL